MKEETQTKVPGRDTLEKMFLTAKERAQLAEKRAEQAESMLTDLNKRLWVVAKFARDALRSAMGNMIALDKRLEELVEPMESNDKK